MREITYKSLMENDLMKLNKWRFTINQIESELETLNAEYAAIKATNYDKMPSGSGDNIQEEKLVTVIARKDQKEAELKFNKMRVADLERLVQQLPDEERHIIERNVINKDMTLEGLAEEMNYSFRSVINKKNSALMLLAQLRHGAAYQP